MPGAYEQLIRRAHSVYKAAVSPLFGPACRFLPTCSTYACEALIAHGPVRGSALAARRLCRCRPGGGSGYDPVPAAVRPPTAFRCDA